MREACIYLVAAAVALAGCGELETPELGLGVVTGRITGAPGAAVYAVGNPAEVAVVDAEGRFRLPVSVEARQLVLLDGGFRRDDAGNVVSLGRAELLEVEVEGADVIDVGERSAAAMPLAGGVLAGARAESGARCVDPLFRVEGHQDRIARTAAGDVPAVYLAPLPAARLRLTVEMRGFRTQSDDVDVASGATVPYEAQLLVDDDDAERGCLATSGCEGGLECDDDGRCREHGGGGGASGACGDACGSGQPPCGAGLECSGGLCAAPRGCAAYHAVAGSTCVAHRACADALVGGRCDLHDDDDPGICTAPCTGDAQCGAFGAGASCRSGFCRR